MGHGRHRSLLLAGVAILAGCGTMFPQTLPPPHPNVALAQPFAAPVRLVLSSEIPETLRVNDSVYDYRNHDYLHWRETLQTAFTEAFSDANASGATGPAQTLEITRTSANFYYPPAPNTVAVALTYKARLLDANGHVLRVSARTSNSKHGFGGWQEAFANATQSALESMFEEMAADLFVTKAASAQ
jgi:hypothetical protein